MKTAAKKASRKLSKRVAVVKTKRVVAVKASAKALAKASAKALAKARAKALAKARAKALAKVAPVKTGTKVVGVTFAPTMSAEDRRTELLVDPTRRNGPIRVESAIPMRPAKPRSKGAPPPVIAKPKPKPKPKSYFKDEKPRKKIDYSTAMTVTAAAKSQASEADNEGYIVISGRRIRVISSISVKAVKKAERKAGKKIAKFEPLGSRNYTRAELHKQRVVAEVAARTQDGLADHVKVVKSKMLKKELDEYKKILLRLRAELFARVQGIEEDALRSNVGNLSTMPLHMADIGTDAFDQDFALGMAETDRVLVMEIDEALERIENKSFGVCMLTGKPIPKGRLAAKPWARYTIEAARRMEQISATHPS
ncbi:MAG: TraR/DksA C4-type zinc finger protein [Planctomycetota bacterium]|nr:TraR/DksA C4-type zinc finger protein [Planctomycetota bacterium]